MKSWIKKIYKIIIAIIFIGLCCVPFIWSDWFFGTPTTIAAKLTYVGAFIGGILLAINAYFIYRRTKELNRSNNLVAKGQLDTRFKDAATLLAAGNTSAELSGIHALHQIAIEASQTKDQKDYVKVIKDILTAFIKENSVMEFIDENGKIIESHNTKSYIILQTIVDKLFKDEGCEIYTEYIIDLSGTVLKEISFQDAELENTHFLFAQLQGSCFQGAELENTWFTGALLQYVDFGNASSIAHAVFFNASWNIETNFKGTAFENKTIEELTKIMSKPPTPLDE